ncbi:MAG: acyltransferase family protein, partial [Bacilli bacterium]|nr:acyltransferase family protein [Bacilli bacterium]
MKRIAYFDNVKGILILFIILAHVISLCASYYDYDNKILKLNCMFMLQCFFFISGYFASKSKTRKSKKILKQIKTYLFWDILITFYYGLVLHIIDFNFNLLLPRYT